MSIIAIDDMKLPTSDIDETEMQRDYKTRLADLLAFQREHYAARLAAEKNPAARSFLRAELHRLKNAGYGF